MEKIDNKEEIFNKIINEFVGDNFVELEIIYEVIEEIGTNEKVM